MAAKDIKKAQSFMITLAHDRELEHIIAIVLTGGGISAAMFGLILLQDANRIMKGA